MSKAPPQRVRIAKLQEAQLDQVVAIDAACRELLRRSVPTLTEPARGAAGIAHLTKLHDVLVADADGAVAGFAAWRDESPGVAYLEELAVKPDMPDAHRVDIGMKLLEAVREAADRLSLPILLTRCWSKATETRALLEKAGFGPLGDDAGERAKLWREEQESAGALAKEGEVVLVRALL
jgi:amino-acid N-acetyltransferase